MGEATYVSGQEVYGRSLYLSLTFLVNLTLLLKNEIVKKIGTEFNSYRISVLQDEAFCKWMHFIHNVK